MPTTVLWLRRDLRLHDHPALVEAARDGAEVVPLFVLDPGLLKPSGPARTAFLLRSLRALDDDLRAHGGRLVVRHGRPEDVVPAVAGEVGAAAAHVSEDFGPYGRVRDERVCAALAAQDPSVPMVATGSPYAVAPGRVTTKSGGHYQVFGPFYRAWTEHGWRAPADSDPSTVAWRTARSDDLPDEPASARDVRLPEPGEEAAHAAWHAFRDRIADYPADRERPGVDGTSRMSAYLKLGTVHVRTLLADLGHDDGSDTFRRELAWREFYAAVLAARPESARDYLHPQLEAMPYATGRTLEKRLQAWERGETGYPIVDAGMRQLLAEGWMHNRVRMIVASFLVKDLHVEWTHGARHFMRHLVDGDLASNQHNWQWVAGCGTDAAPFFRIFNPTTQGRKFDPEGAYVRRWVRELADVEGRHVHDPWELPEQPEGYPEPIVDHATERAASLTAYEALRR
ncbi:deoxyribodipyrimidine photo-lyase [Nocardioides terrae]|uniref:Deoxyribodipyrimidine photo-lyase n=1 Tax=Nocardioides terrae TaxID=574651 RepID=A0A1I1IAV4_9ACTN|nr:deoxyribodipyrimidine photo-lyase [Nocardioides terrae]SFC31388.1 deoxyribodipyrimidine photo-lyase [Nocardioides terrae]